MQDIRSSVSWCQTMVSGLFFLTACLGWVQDAKPVISVSIDPGKSFQEIDGFGVNFNGPYFRESAKPMVDMQIDDLGASLFRLDAYGFDLSNWEVVNDNFENCELRPSFYGLMRDDNHSYSPEKRYYAEKQLYHFVRPGAVRIADSVIVRQTYPAPAGCCAAPR
jgi:hypothetical protein